MLILLIQALIENKLSYGLNPVVQQMQKKLNKRASVLTPRRMSETLIPRLFTLCEIEKSRELCGTRARSLIGPICALFDGLTHARDQKYEAFYCKLSFVQFQFYFHCFSIRRDCRQCCHHTIRAPVLDGIRPDGALAVDGQQFGGVSARQLRSAWRARVADCGRGHRRREQLSKGTLSWGRQCDYLFCRPRS